MTAITSTPATRRDEVLGRAVEKGLLPESARTPAVDDSRPWPVLLLTAFGAWLAALPLMGFAALLLGPLMRSGAGAYVVATAALGAGLMLLRSAGRSTFVEQLAVPVIIAGYGLLGVGLFRDLHDTLALVLLAVATLGGAAVVPSRGLRVLLAAAAASLFAAALARLGLSRMAAWQPSALQAWAGWHAVLALWLLMMLLQARTANARLAAWLEDAGTGVCLAIVGGLAFLSGMTFMAGGVLGVRELAPGLQGRSVGGEWLAMRLGSVLLMLAGTVWLARCWPELRRAPYALVAAVLAALCGLMPMLGGIGLVAAVCLASGRIKRATASAVAMAWVIGAFYYSVPWRLTTKAAALAQAGVVLGIAAIWLWRSTRAPSRATRGSGPAHPAAARLRNGWLLPVGAIAATAISQWAIEDKESLIATGRPAFVELAPVDPRSLMQGDFMALNWKMDEGLRQQLDRLAFTRRPVVAARRDERQVLHLQRLITPEQPLQPGEERVELSPHDGRWMVVSNAWFFREGDGARWARARYGELRLLPDGRALLVGLRGADLEPL